ncbi:PEP-CTERM putative exosortase interaction domain-containing protein [Opitutaceae bacterium TAV1]|nr:PEP-CTERM putative exosortase interaction domain-containing protein [Opitutaceae bacterium TAV1]
MNILKSILCSIAIVPAISSAGIFSPNWYTDASGATQLYISTGDKLPDGFTFDIGIFSSGVDFSDPSTLASNFRSLGATGFPWDNNMLGPGIGGAAYQLSFSDVYPEGLAAGDQVYVWGYNTTDLESVGVEWIVITNPSWILQEIPAGLALASKDWTITDDGTQYLLGHIDADKVFTASVSAVPEPATYAAIFGSLTLASVLVARRRRATVV